MMISPARRIAHRAALGAISALMALALPGAAAANDRITLGLNWLAQCEHGGFYFAAANGLYEKAGLDVVIRSGGPQVNTSQLLAGGAVDIALMGGSSMVLSFVEQKAPFVAVAALFQKDPAILMSHPGVGNDTLAALKGKPIMIAADAWNGFWPYLKQRYGYSDDQIRAYTFNAGPFIADPHAIIQGYITNDPFSLQEAGIQANIFLIADDGYSSYSHILTTSRRLVEQHPDVVQRFVTATIAGWNGYLTGDPSAADAAIIRSNPDYSEAHAKVCRDAIRNTHLMDSGDAKSLGVGAMTEARWRAFAEMGIAAGLYSSDIDWHAAFTTQFVDKGPD